MSENTLDISRITQHFESLGIRKIEIPEWDAVIYCTPVTVAERTRIFAGLKGENDFEVCVRALIEKARDENGKKLFTAADRPALLQKADADVLITVAAKILNNSAPRADELKN